MAERSVKRRRIDLAGQDHVEAAVSPIKAIRDHARQSPIKFNPLLSPHRSPASNSGAGSPSTPSRALPLSRSASIFKQFSVSKQSPLKDATAIDGEPGTPSRRDSRVVLGPVSSPVSARHVVTPLPDDHAQQSPTNTSRNIDASPNFSEGDVRASGRARKVTEKMRDAGKEKTPRTVSSQKRQSAKSVHKIVRQEPGNEKSLSAALAQVDSQKRMNKENITPTPSTSFEKEQPVISIEKSSNKSTKRKLVSVDTQVVEIVTQTKEIVNDDVIAAEHIRQFQNTVLSRLTGKQPIPLQGLDEEYAKVSSVISHVVERGESNSMLLIGARGVGKTALMNQILQEQRIKHPDHFHVVRLNGFIHTDDKIALRDIWRQLGHEMELDESDSNLTSHADSLSMLLALLSHPEELEEGKTGHVAKSVIFIIDEFDLFATHPRQTLLYNLFDIAQSRKAPIAVVGMTTRVDAVESLEKRVKSRFSHRYVHLSQSKSFDSFLAICKSPLVIESKGVRRTTREKSSDAAAGIWNQAMDVLFENEAFLLAVKTVFYRTRSIPDFFASLLVPMSTLSGDLTGSGIVEHLSLSSSSGPDSKLDNMCALSTLQIALLVCAARQTAIYSVEVVTFSLAYEEYKSIAAKSKIQASAAGALGAGRVLGKEVARKAWQDLVDMKMILSGRVDVGLEELAQCDLGPWTKWCKEI